MLLEWVIAMMQGKWAYIVYIKYTQYIYKYITIF